MEFDLIIDIVNLLLVVGLVLVLCFTYYTTAGIMSYLEEVDNRVADMEYELSRIQRRVYDNSKNASTRTEMPLESQKSRKHDKCIMQCEIKRI